MNFSDDTDAKVETVLHGAAAGAELAREEGVPFQPPIASNAGIDPIAEWLSLMEVVQMLCPVWPARDKPMKGNHWRL